MSVNATPEGQHALQVRERLEAEQAQQGEQASSEATQQAAQQVRPVKILNLSRQRWGSLNQRSALCSLGLRSLCMHKRCCMILLQHHTRNAAASAGWLYPPADASPAGVQALAEQDANSQAYVPGQRTDISFLDPINHADTPPIAVSPVPQLAMRRTYRACCHCCHCSGPDHWSSLTRLSALTYACWCRCNWALQSW